MIDAEPPLAGLALADPAHTALPPQHRLVVRKRDSVFGLEGASKNSVFDRSV
jgi:hypothetical protein